MNDSESLQDRINDWRKDASNLSYEEALQALDLILAELQDDAVPMADLQRQVLHGQVYLDHCESLLKTMEEAVVQLDPDTLEPSDDA
jgi:exodeoxyribonuclease VII small subunit|tara:strand:- start:388 stop:648 length:261 start_codon:yes stop_codon:yes gene_type:complete